MTNKLCQPASYMQPSGDIIRGRRGCRVVCKGIAINRSRQDQRGKEESSQWLEKDVEEGVERGGQGSKVERYGCGGCG